MIASVAFAVAPIAAISAWRNGARDVALETARLGAVAQVVAALAADATGQDDAQGAFRALRAIGQMKDVEYGRIEALDGRRLVETGSGARLASDTRAEGLEQTFALSQLFSHTSEVSAPIIYAGSPVGRVVLLGRTEGMLRRFLVTLGESLAVAGIAILVGLLIAWRLKERIARPILALTAAMRSVQQTHDYASGVTVAADGEIGELVGGFSQMMSEIRVRDERIAAQMAGLETEVAVRTAELVIARDLAEAANNAKSDFLATMSHEIRTPMNGVMAMAEMLAAGRLPPRERRFAEVIVKSGESLLAIINDILDFSKMEAGKLELECIRTELTDIVDDVLSLFWDRAASKGLDLAGYVDPGLPEVVAGDPVRLRQVISNLVNNAIKFTDAGGVFVEVVPVSAAKIRIAVRDTGIGVDEAKISSLFDAFTQADQSTTRRFGGTGLGLAICKRLVEAMQGEWEISSRLGEGSTFAFVISLPEVAPPPAWPQAPAIDAIATVAHEGRFTAQVLRAYLERSGYAAAEGAGALSVGSPAGLRSLSSAPAISICVAAYGDSAPEELLRAGVAQAVLTQPLRRQELMSLLGLVEARKPLTGEMRADRPASSDRPPSFAGARVLVADDSAVNREVALEALRRLDIEARLVGNGQAAIDAAREAQFDIILMDGSMPDMSGFDASREIRRVERAEKRIRVPIIAVTAHVIGAAAEAWRDADMDGILHKPFTFKALAETLDRFVQRAPTAALIPSAHPRLEEDAPPAQPRQDEKNDTGELLDSQIAAQLESFAAAGRGEFVRKVIQLYRENAPSCIVDLAAAAGSGDSVAVASAAHALKSMSYSIGAKMIAARAAEMEAAAFDGALPDDNSVAKLSTLLNATLTTLGRTALLTEAA